MFRSACIALLLLVANASIADARRTPAPAPSPSAAAIAPSAPVMPASPGAPQPYAPFVAKAERQTGLIDIVKKDDDVYFDLSPAELDRPFIVAPVLAAGVGADAFAGRVFRPFVLSFKRVGRRILWIERNTDFAADPGTSAASALAISVTDSVINSTPIVAEDDVSHRTIISAAFFLTDYESVGKSLSESDEAGPILLLGGLGRTGYTVDPLKSYIERTKTFVQNDEILASLAFSGAPGDLHGAPDARGVRLAMHYSIIASPVDDGYMPRIADDRVGYFITAHRRFDDDAAPSPFVRYIDRYDFAHRGPLVYYLTNEIPAQYKPAIRTALLKWNGAFAKIGIPNAVEVRDAPNDPAWDPDDVRYSTVRWLTSANAAFAAYGPHVEDPRTGEILRVEIVISGEALRSIKRGFVDQVVPSRGAVAGAYGLPVAGSSLRLACDDAECDRFDDESAQAAALGTTALRAGGATPAATERYAEDWLQAAVLHESGHNFGLRHNFIASTLYSLHDLHDKHFTDTHGLSASVMGYAPVNLSPPGKPQGDYFQLSLGPYDDWAIRYGYATFANVRRPEDELPALHGIADESVRPGYGYASDEDVSGPLSVDPRVATFALSSDPLAFDANQFALVDALIGRLDATYPRTDEPYSQERQTFETMLLGYERAAMLASHYVGGIYTSRDHRGEPGGAPPLRPVPRALAKRAFAMLADNIFSSRALHFSPRLLADLGPNHYLHRGVDSADRPDFPIAEVVGSVQDAVMLNVFSPDVMSRLADQPLETAHPADTMSLDDLFTWMQAAVWDDLATRTTSTDPMHRALQRRYTNLLVAMSLAPSFLVEALGYPSDTAPLARFELRHLLPAIDARLRTPNLDVGTRAHLEDVQSRVRRALEPTAARGA